MERKVEFNITKFVKCNDLQSYATIYCYFLFHPVWFLPSQNVNIGGHETFMQLLSNNCMKLICNCFEIPFSVDIIHSTLG